MSGRVPFLRVLLPVGVLSGYVVASRIRACETRCDGEVIDDGPGDGAESLRTKIATQLEAWLLPSGEAGSLGPMLKELGDAIAEDTQLSQEEGKRLPLNALMVKAMHERERLATRGEARRRPRPADLDPSDREIVRTAARFSKFAAASYGVVKDHLKEVVTQGAAMPPADLLMNRPDSLQKWFISQRTSIEPDDVKKVAMMNSVETRAYLLAVDHSTRSVVLAIRGTYSISDTMVDLLCNRIAFAGGSAHHGISQSAVRVWAAVKEQVERLLREHDDYQLVLTGHSLGAGTAILLKILLEQQTKAAGQEGDPAGSRPSARLDAGRPVHMECYAFAPPPVFSGPGAVGMPNIYSFVNGSDCVPTVSLGSLYSLFRTMKNVDQLPLDIYKRAEFILDARVRVQQDERALRMEGGGEDKRTIASDVLDIGREHSAPLFGGSGCEDADGIDPAPDKTPKTDSGDQSEATKKADADTTHGSGEDAQSVISAFKGDVAQFAQDVGDAAERLCDDVGKATEGILSVPSDEQAFTALLLKQVATGRGPSPDEMLAMVQKCHKDGSRPQKGSRYSRAAIGDLVIPGKVYLLEGGVDSCSHGLEGRGPREIGGGGVWNDTVRGTSSKELGGIRLSNRMLDDHSMDVYEPTMLAAAQRYSDK